MNSFDCPICCDTVKIGKRFKVITCPQSSCGHSVCSNCQKKYEQPHCMNCLQPFKYDVLITILGKDFFQNVIVKKITQELILKEKELISDTKPLIDWYDQKERVKQLFLRGLFTIDDAADRPIIQHNKLYTVNKACSVTGCNGVLTKDFVCGACGKKHCEHCHVLITRNHKCDPNVLENLKDIHENSKPCPKCHVSIYKIEGCDHMHCTHCDTHFHWVTNNILRNSSNHHYRHLLRVTPPETTCQMDATEQQIPEDVFREQCLNVPEPLLYLLYEHGDKVRQYYLNECNVHNLTRQHLLRNDDLRVKFIKNRISEKQWGRFLFNSHRLHVLKTSISDIIELYLLYVNEIQSLVYNSPNTQNDYHSQLIELMKTCNVAFTALYDEYNLHSVVSETAFAFAIPTEDSPTVVVPFIKVKAQTEKTSLVVSCEASESAKQIQLLEHQIQHYDRICDILTKNNITLDLSPLGTGKTYVTCKYLQQHTFSKIYICCPAALKSKWATVTKEYSIPAFIMSYHELAGIKYTQLKHKLLIRNDFEKTRQDGLIVKGTKYHVSDIYTQLTSIQNGVCFIFDEIQCIKSGTTNFTGAARAIMKPLISNTLGNKVILISGTPFDNEEHIVTFYRNTGIQKANELFQYNPATGENEKTGYGDIILFCISLDTEKKYRNLIREAWSFSIIKYAHPLLLQLFLTIITHYLTSSMTQPVTMGDITNINSYYRIHDRNDLVLYKRAIRGLLAVVDSDNVSRGLHKHIALFRSLQLLEFSKVNLICKEVIQTIQDNQQCKIVVTMNFNESLLKLHGLLKAYNPQLVNGSVSKKKRNEIITAFQQPSTEVSVLLCNLTVVSTGIDLDDKDGHFPRFVFVSPTYSFTHMYQHSCRYSRSTDTKSGTLIRYVYGDDDIPQQSNLCYAQTSEEFQSKIRGSYDGDLTLEFRILQRLHSKAEIVSKVSQNNCNILFLHQLMK